MTDSVERLRLRSDPLNVSERADVAAEIDRLRDGYEQCRTTLKNVAEDRDAKEAEIKRLRGLLRWIRDGGAKADDPDMWRQVDETLDDNPVRQSNNPPT